jgi:ribose-phosphate pyrophosphokinase
MENARLIACNSHPGLAKAISETLKIPIVNKPTKYFANDETRVCLDGSVRGLDIFIVATGYSVAGKSVNDAVMELFFMIRTCKRSGANSVTVLLPHYPYARQDKKDNARAPISARDFADMLEMSGVDRIVCLDLHNSSIQGFFNKPCDNIYGSLALKPFLHEKLFATDPKYREHYVAIAPDEGGFKRTTKYAKLFGLPFLAMSKSRDYSKENVVEKSVLHGDRQLLVGKTAIIFDDMCDTGGTVVAAAKELKENGAKDVIVCVTHGLLSGPGLERIMNSPDVAKFICSDSVPQGDRAEKCSKMLIFSVAPIFADIVRRLINRQSLSELFE